MEHRLAEVRERKGFKQAELARRVNLSRGQVANLEAGNRTMDLPTLRRFASALDCSVVDLLLPEDAPGMPNDEEREILAEFRKAPDYDPRNVLIATQGVLATVRAVTDAAQIPRELRGDPSLAKRLSARWDGLDDRGRLKLLQFLDSARDFSAR